MFVGAASKSDDIRPIGLITIGGNIERRPVLVLISILAEAYNVTLCHMSMR
jgi:hypothetical protein